MQYNNGETIRLTAYYNLDTSIVEFVPNKSEEITFEFSKTPIADFIVNQNLIKEGDSVSFFDKSHNSPDNWIWTFGDGESSILKNPVHSYVEEGFYTVKLVVSNSSGTDSIIKSNFIEVEDNSPIADFIADTSIVGINDVINFTDLSLNDPSTWNWNFGDGNTSNLQNPSHSYNIIGNYTVSLTASNAYGSDSENKTNFIKVIDKNPIAEFKADTNIVGIYDTINFTDLSLNNPTSWQWDFGDGNASNLQNPSYFYNNVGVYSVTLTVSNQYGNDSQKKNKFY